MFGEANEVNQLIGSCVHDRQQKHFQSDNNAPCYGHKLIERWQQSFCRRQTTRSPTYCRVYEWISSMASRKRINCGTIMINSSAFSMIIFKQINKFDYVLGVTWTADGSLLNITSKVSILKRYDSVAVAIYERTECGPK